MSRSRARWLRGVLAVLAVVGLVVGCSAIERSLVYPATRYSQAEFEQRVAQRFAGGATVLAPFDALIIEAPAASASQAVATAVYFHGNGDVSTNLAALAPVFAQRNMRLVLAEYPGYGARSGTPSEHALVDDARALYAALVERYRGTPIIVVGQSLGSGVAAQVAADATAEPPSRLVLITPFLNLPEAAAHAFGGLPVQSIVSDRYDSAAALARYAGPAAVLVADDDRLIGPEQGRQLARTPRSHGQTLLLDVPGATHDNWPRAMTAARWDTLLLGAPASR